MGWSGQLNAWAWRNQARIIKDKQQKEKTLHEELMEGYEEEKKELDNEEE